MIVVKLDAFSVLKRPVWQKAFGRNKTWRGFVVVPLATTLGCYVAAQLQRLAPATVQLDLGEKWLSLGFLLGFAYVLFELPNSFIKRRLGVKEGQLPNQHKALFFAMDHLDSATGCCLVYVYYLQISLVMTITALLWGVVIHSVVNYVLYLLHIRQSPT